MRRMALVALLLCLAALANGADFTGVSTGLPASGFLDSCGLGPVQSGGGIFWSNFGKGTRLADRPVAGSEHCAI